MPVYEFECTSCGQSVELLIRSHEKEKPRCSCGSLKLKKAFSAPAIHSKAKQARTVAKATRTACSARTGGGGCACH